MRSWLAPDFRRFVPAWLVFASSMSLAAFAILAPQSILGLMDPGGGEDAPPMLVLMLSVFIYVGALAIGPLVVPFRRLLIGPKFPFVRRGYIVVAFLPLIWFANVELTWSERLFLVVAFEVFFCLGALVFVWLGSWFRAFDPEERAPKSRGTSGR